MCSRGEADRSLSFHGTPVHHNPQDGTDRDPLNVVSDDIEPQVFETEPVHQHLPMVERMGFISWDRDANESSKGPDWDAVAPLLGLIHGHREELPEG